jgi:ketosteroid isomerase-like protein
MAQKVVVAPVALLRNRRPCTGSGSLLAERYCVGMRSNIEIVRSAMEAFNRRDAQAFGADFAPDVVIVPVRAAVEGTLYRGPDKAAAYCAAVEESWESLRWDVEEIREGDDWVLALGHIRGRGRGSGAEFDARAGWVIRFRDGQVTSFHTCPDRAEALGEVGLHE